MSDTPQWDREHHAWIATVTTLAGPIAVEIDTDDEDDPPTAMQLKALDSITNFSAKQFQQISDLVVKWAHDTMDKDDLADMEEEDFEYRLHSATIPKLRATTELYVVFVGNSEIEPEHGIGCISHNGRRFAVVHPDTARDIRDWDDLKTLNSFI